MDQPGHDERRGKTIGRRTLVRAGVTSAWTAPLVLTSVPAYATTCSAGPTTGTLTYTTESATLDPEIDQVFRGLAHLTITGPVGTTVLGARATRTLGGASMRRFTFSTWPTAGDGSSQDTLAASPALATDGIFVAAGATVSIPFVFELVGNPSGTIRLDLTGTCDASFSVLVNVFSLVVPV